MCICASGFHSTNRVLWKNNLFVSGDFLHVCQNSLVFDRKCGTSNDFLSFHSVLSPTESDSSIHCGLDHRMAIFSITRADVAQNLPLALCLFLSSNIGTQTVALITGLDFGNSGGWSVESVFSPDGTTIVVLVVGDLVFSHQPTFIANEFSSCNVHFHVVTSAFFAFFSHYIAFFFPFLVTWLP